jgi:hypothetical protein
MSHYYHIPSHSGGAGKGLKPIPTPFIFWAIFTISVSSSLCPMTRGILALNCLILFFRNSPLLILLDLSQSLR